MEGYTQAESYMAATEPMAGYMMEVPGMTAEMGYSMTGYLSVKKDTMEMNMRVCLAVRYS